MRLMRSENSIAMHVIVAYARSPAYDRPVAGLGRGVLRRWRRLAAAVALACVALALIAAAHPVTAHAQQQAPLQVTVVPPSDAPGPRPTGELVFSAFGAEFLRVPLAPGTDPLTALTPMISSRLLPEAGDFTVTYTGDSNYEASDGVTLTVPTPEAVTITARPRDRAAPEIEILSPADGARYGRTRTLVSSYSCRDPGNRSAVTTCDGAVVPGGALASRAPVPTAVTGTFSFTVRSADALGNAATKTVTYAVVDGPGEEPATTGSSAQADPPARADSRPIVPLPDAPFVPPPPPFAALPAIAAATIERAAPATRPPAARRPAVRRPAARPSPARAPRSRATPRVVPTTTGSSLADPFAEPLVAPSTWLAILVAAFALLQLGARSGGLALAAGAGGVAGRQPDARAAADRRRLLLAAGPPSSGHGSTGVQYLGAGFDRVGIGDRSWTWRWPATRALDALAFTLPARLAPRSPLLARVVADGTYLRAMLGSSALLGPLAGLALGVAAVSDSGGDALPPATALVIAIAVLGVLDATAGFVAVLTFAAGVVALGGVDSNAGLRVMLALGALWFVLPVLAGAARPLRRPPTRSFADSWDRGADVVIASLIGAWAVQKIGLALPGLAGEPLPIAEHADTVALCALAALVARLGLETLATHLYPWRLDVTEAGPLPNPRAPQRLASIAVRAAIFVFLATIVVGSSWQLWVGTALFVAPRVLAIYEQRMPSSATLHRLRPKGIVEVVLMLAIGTAIAALLLREMDENAPTFLADAFVLLAIPGFVLSLVERFGRGGSEPVIGWGKRIAGVAILVVGLALALG